MDERSATPMDMCPMTAICRGMAGGSGPGSRAGFLLLLPGLLLILGGVLILVEPRVLVWLIGGTSILIGIIVLLFASFILKIAGQVGEIRS